MSLSIGTPIKLSKVKKREFIVPIKNRSGGLLGFLRILFIGVEVLATFLPFGQLFQAGVALAGGLAQAALTGVSYAEGNIRGTGALVSSLALDIVPAILPIGSYAIKGIKSGGIVVSTIADVEEAAKVERVFVKGSNEYKTYNKILKADKVKSKIGTLARTNGLVKVERVSKLRMNEYRQILLREQIELGKDTTEIEKNLFEKRIQEAISTKTTISGRDIAVLRQLKTSNQISKALKYDGKFIMKQLSRQARLDIGTPANLRNLINDLAVYVNSRKITSKINRIFASGESDWATKEFWEAVRNGKILKSGNFYTQTAQLFNPNDFARELISKPFNALSRKIKKWTVKLREKIFRRTKWAVKVFRKEEMIRKELEKNGKYWGGNFITGYRIIQDLGKSKTILIKFNPVTTNAVTYGSKNRGGKKDLVIPNYPNYLLKQWNKSPDKGDWYLNHIALSKGGRAIGHNILSDVLSTFLTFIPIQALRNILSIISNVKGVIKDIKAGTYLSGWGHKFTDTIHRLYLHKIGKTIGSAFSIFGKGAGKEGQRIGLGVAKGFQHKKGLSVGKFDAKGILKETIPGGFAGTVKRKSRGRSTASGNRRSTKRVGVNLHRIIGIPKI